MNTTLAAFKWVPIKASATGNMRTTVRLKIA
jgi:hypothetical protein